MKGSRKFFFDGNLTQISVRFYTDFKSKSLCKLVWNVKEGWAPLCEFLGKPVPDCPLPHDNKTGSNWFEEYGYVLHS